MLYLLISGFSALFDLIIIEFQNNDNKKSYYQFLRK